LDRRRARRSWHNDTLDRGQRLETSVNVLEGLQTIRLRLVENGAAPETLALVDAIMQRAALPAAAPASAQSLLQLTRMLARTPAASANIAIYNDLLRLEEELQTAGQQYHERAEAEAAKPIPKTKKHYKQIRDREERKNQAS
jgi:DNA-binding SARP family transcriptional activator